MSNLKEKFNRPAGTGGPAIGVEHATKRLAHYIHGLKLQTWREQALLDALAGWMEDACWAAHNNNAADSKRQTA